MGPIPAPLESGLQVHERREPARSPNPLSNLHLVGAWPSQQGLDRGNQFGRLHRMHQVGFIPLIEMSDEFLALDGGR